MACVPKASRSKMIYSPIFAPFLTSFSHIIRLKHLSLSAGYLPSREPLFDFIHNSVNDHYACTLVWAVSHYSTDSGSSGTLFGSNDGQGYVFGYDGDGSAAVKKQYAYMKQKVREKHCFFLLPKKSQMLFYIRRHKTPRALSPLLKLQLQRLKMVPLRTARLATPSFWKGEQRMVLKPRTLPPVMIFPLLEISTHASSKRTGANVLNPG